MSAFVIWLDIVAVIYGMAVYVVSRVGLAVFFGISGSHKLGAWMLMSSMFVLWAIGAILLFVTVNVTVEDIVERKDCRRISRSMGK